DVLFNELGLPKTKRIKTGHTTDSEALTSLLAQTGHPVLEHLLRHRDVAKLMTIVDSLIPMAGEDGRIHTTFNQTVAATGRLSSTDPNLQNIPIRSVLGRQIRLGFVVGTGYECLLSADYSQIELRITPDQARGLMEEYFKEFGGVRDYLHEVVSRARMDGYTATMMGRRRYLPDLTSDNRQRREMAERMALNAPIQGSAADVIKVA